VLTVPGSQEVTRVSSGVIRDAYSWLNAVIKRIGVKGIGVKGYFSVNCSWVTGGDESILR
jgi:hypothetical protein